MVKLLIGGSPCTFWSIAQKNGREVTAEGLGWELFKNYLIAKEKFKPDFFLYENNKSAAQPIKDQIARELGVDLMYINSALVSAQNRQRFYAFNWTVEQPEDRGIYLKDILESSEIVSEKGYALAEPLPLNTTTDGKAQCLRACSYKDGIRNLVGNTVDRRTCVAEPVRIGTVENDAKKQTHDSKQYRVYSPEGKATTLCGEGGGLGAKTGLYATPVRVGTMPNRKGEEVDHQSHRIFSTDGKAPTLCARPNGGGPETGLYAVPAPDAASMSWRGRGDGSQFEVRSDGKSAALTTGHQNRWIAQMADGKTAPVYEVTDGEIEINGKKYPIKLPDGHYIIRKLTPVECERLQTLPDNYTAAVSNTQRYRGLGNGWTAEVIIHILTGALKDVPRDEEIVVLSMYDGIGTGRYCLEKMGFTNVTYYAYEIDGPAMKVALSNYPDIIQCGDAFDLRRDDWELGKRFSKEQPTEKATEAARDGDATDPADAPSDANLPTHEECDETESREEAPRQRNEFDDDVIDVLLELRDERYQLSQINSKNRRYSFEVRALEYAVSILEAVT